jgi:predicted kinase
MIEQFSINKKSKYRLYDRKKGVVGPPHKDSDKIINLKTFSENISVEWSTSGIQEVDYFDTELQEFVEHEIALEMLIQQNWNSLLKQTHLVRSSVPKYILFTGLPGSGKTTLAKKLSSRTGWLHFDFADFAYQVLGDSPLMMNDYRKIGALAEKKINDVIKDGISVIYDTTSASSKTRQLHFDAVEYTYIKHTIYVHTDSEVCLNRVSLRRPASPIDLRKGIHRSSPNHIRTFYDYVNDYEAPNDCLVVNNESDVDIILRWLGKL